MNRTIVLVDFYWTRDKDPRVPLGHASLLTSLRGLAGVVVVPLVVAVNEPHLDDDGIVDQIMAVSSDRASDTVDAAFGAYVWGESLLQRVLRKLRERGFRGRIILGGPQVSYSGIGLEQHYPQADAFVRGHGEEALRELAVTGDRRKIRGVHWAGEDDQREVAAVQLESLPSPWLSGAIPLHGQSFVRWETQRGCPYRCSFCQHREPGEFSRRRTLNSERIASEIELFCASGVREIAVLDPIFNMPNHAVPILQKFAELGFRGRISLQCRAELVDSAFLDAAAALNVCLEFGLQTVHADEARRIDRANQIEKVDTALTGVRDRKIDHEVSLIFGLPQQTLASFESSVAWCLERSVPVIKAFPLMLLRGTKLDQEREIWGMEESSDEMPMVIRSNSFSNRDWALMNQLSLALKQTEGRHPTSIEDLKRLAAGIEADSSRWTPVRQDAAE
jgi:radical SAM superfamily enzyme YgiQ (UPF0313 family)